jgi:ribosomal-protein-alanine N-acetyltransferase
MDPKYVSLLWAGPDQAGAIAALHTQLFDPPWDEAGIRALLDHPASTAFVAMIGNPKTAVGFVMGQLAADEAEILSIGVAKEWQRKGIGRRLVDGLARAVARAEVKRVFLEVAADNAAALALYRRLGFAEQGRRTGYYARKGGPAVDALKLALNV